MLIGTDKLCVHRQKVFLLSLGIIGVDAWLESKVEDRKIHHIKHSKKEASKETWDFMVTNEVQYSCAVRAGNETHGE